MSEKAHPRTRGLIFQRLCAVGHHPILQPPPAFHLSFVTACLSSDIAFTSSSRFTSSRFTRPPPQTHHQTPGTSSPKTRIKTNIIITSLYYQIPYFEYSKYLIGKRLSTHSAF